MPNNVEDGLIRSYYAHENNTLAAGSKLVATKADLAKVKNVLSNTDVIEACAKERANTKWKFHKLINVTIFAALLTEIYMWSTVRATYEKPHF